MCRSRPSLPRAALVKLPERRRIDHCDLLFSPSSARTVLFLLFSCSSSSVLRRPPSYPATGGHHRDRPARPSTPPCPGGSSASGGAAQRRTTALQSATTSASRRRQRWPAHRTQPLHAAGTRPEAPCAANGHTKGISVLGETRQPSAGGRTSSQVVTTGR